MKKLIAILLVVLVAGFVFGAADATLTLSSEVKFAVNHGFSADPFTSYLDIIGGPFALNGTEKEVNLVSGNSQEIGSYSFASNAINDFTVSLTFGAMNATFNSGKYQIPYSFVLTKGEEGSVGSSVDETSTGGAVGLVVVDLEDGSDNLGSETIELFDGLADHGPTWASYLIEIKVDPEAISEYGLPVGYYKGNIVASITAE